MFSRVVIRASDPEASRRFYEAVLPELGRLGAAEELALTPATPDAPPTTRLHVGLAAASPAHVEAFWRAGLAAGFESDGEPGPRPQYAPGYHGAFLLDPDGNSIEAVHYDGMRRGGAIDHLWMRVGFVTMTRRFYEATAAQAGSAPRDGADAVAPAEPLFSLVASEPGLARFRSPDGASFTIVEGADPTTGIDLSVGAARFVDDDGRSLRLRRT